MSSQQYQQPRDPEASFSLSVAFMGLFLLPSVHLCAVFRGPCPEPDTWHMPNETNVWKN